MHRTFAHIRRTSLALGALFVWYGVVPQAQAADQTPQRVAMACTHTSEGAGCQRVVPAASRQAPSQHASSETHATKPQARSSREVRPTSTASSDGSRFAYDSCGCSND